MTQPNETLTNARRVARQQLNSFLADPTNQNIVLLTATLHAYQRVVCDMVPAGSNGDDHYAGG